VIGSRLFYVPDDTELDDTDELCPQCGESVEDCECPDFEYVEDDEDDDDGELIDFEDDEEEDECEDDDAI
jgi:hypothetical protein